MKKVLFSGIGDTDPLRGGYDGPMLHIVRHFRPERVYLFLTADMSKRQRDTECYSKAIHFLNPECDVRPIFTDIEVASDFDAFHDAFDQQIDKIREENKGAEILLNVSSGTPQMKTTMCLEVVSHNEPLTPVQVSNPENKSGRGTGHFDCYKGDLLDELSNLMDNLEEAGSRCSEPDLLGFRKSMIKNQVRALVSSFEYKGAYELVKKSDVRFTNRLELLLYHAFQRSLPNEKKAETAARELEMEEKLYLVRQSNAKRVCEYYLAAKLRQQRGELTDFILRIKTLGEALLQIILEKEGLNRIAKQQKNGSWKLDSQKADKVFSGLMEYLDDRYGNGYKTDTWLNMDSMIYILEFLNSKADKAKYDPHLKAFNEMKKISRKRNDSAHQLESVTEESLGKELETSSQRLMKILESLIVLTSGKGEISVEQFNIYETLNNYIYEELDKQES